MSRVWDVFFSAVLLIVLSPLLLVIVVLIKLSSKGPVMFKQRRIGQCRKEFLIYKFRTMRIDSPGNVPTHMLENPEKYITAIGSFLRKTSLDELPQLYNILKGDMSFVGPRPALYNQDDLISMREACGVHCVKPGITGWAQVNGRDELSIHDKVEYDRYYVENKSVMLDMLIVLKTIINAVTGKGVVEGKHISAQESVKALMK